MHLTCAGKPIDFAVLQVVDGQVVTREERSFVESMLAAQEGGQEGGTFGDDAAQLAADTQKTVKINHLSFNENGESKSSPSTGIVKELLQKLSRKQSIPVQKQSIVPMVAF